MGGMLPRDVNGGEVLAVRQVTRQPPVHSTEVNGEQQGGFRRSEYRLDVYCVGIVEGHILEVVEIVGGTKGSPRLRTGTTR